MSYIVVAIPAFLLFIIIEWLVSKFMHKNIYRLNDFVNDISCGVIQQVSSVFFKVILFGVYFFIHEKYAVFNLESNFLTWCILFILVDFCFYWSHRFSHTVPIGWAGHVVHHQSEEYNFAVALRQGSFEPLCTFIFYLPLAIIGFPVQMYIIIKLSNSLYQFWVHTRLINKVGIFELFMNTPSHHRVHHAKNIEYISKNYAGVFIIWDKMFGTFTKETIDPKYGTLDVLNSWNPIWANFKYIFSLGKLSYHAPYFMDKIKVWFMPFGWHPRGLKNENNVIEQGKYNPIISFSLSFYVLVQFFIVVLATCLFLGNYGTFSNILSIGIVAFIFTSTLTLGFILDKKKYAILCEVTRLFAFGILFFCVLLAKNYEIYLYINSFFVLISLAWILSVFTKKSSLAHP